MNLENFGFKSIIKLSDNEETEISILLGEVEKDENIDSFIFFETSINYNLEMPAWIIVRDNRMINAPLVAVAEIFAPEPGEAELSIVVKQSYRRQGIFTELVNRSLAIVKNSNAGKLLLVFDRKSNIFGKIAKQRNYVLNHCEHTMMLDLSKLNLDLNAAEKLELVDIRGRCFALNNEYIRISAFCFMDSIPDSTILVNSLLSEKKQGLYLISYKNNYCGVISMCEEENKAVIHGLAVLPEFRRKSIASMALDTCFLLLKTKGINLIELEVDSKNAAAFGLYTKKGFVSNKTADYYQIN